MNDLNTLPLIPVIALHQMRPEWNCLIPVLFVPFVNTVSRRNREIGGRVSGISPRAASNNTGTLTIGKNNAKRK